MGKCHACMPEHSYTPKDPLNIDIVPKNAIPDDSDGALSTIHEKCEIAVLEPKESDDVINDVIMDNGSNLIHKAIVDEESDKTVSSQNNNIEKQETKKLIKSDDEIKEIEETLSAQNSSNDATLIDIDDAKQYALNEKTENLTRKNTIIDISDDEQEEMKKVKQSISEINVDEINVDEINIDEQEIAKNIESENDSNENENDIDWQENIKSINLEDQPSIKSIDDYLEFEESVIKNLRRIYTLQYFGIQFCFECKNGVICYAKSNKHSNGKDITISRR